MKNLSATNTAATNAHSGAKSCSPAYPHSSTHMLSPWEKVAIGETSVLARPLRGEEVPSR
jgi:hypothetical protein